LNFWCFGAGFQAFEEDFGDDFWVTVEEFGAVLAKDVC